MNIPVKSYLDNISIDEIIGIVSFLYSFGSFAPQSGIYITDVKFLLISNRILNLKQRQKYAR